jgi:Domain of unknown function (DUF4442)
MNVNENNGFQLFLKKINNPFWVKAFLFTKLPSAFFSGVRLTSIDEKSCSVKVKYKWFSQNPFKSTYFACLAMAAEMSSGLFALGYSYKKTPNISMLVKSIEGTFLKKAIGKTTFTCHDGSKIAAAIQQAINSGEGVAVSTLASGINEAGEEVANFTITWSFKAKK